jgi:DNA-binding NarL/FixJ family response regulator
MSLREAIGKSSPPEWQARFASWLEPARRALSDEEARAAWADGEDMSMEQAVEEALAAGVEAVEDRGADRRAAEPVQRISATVLAAPVGVALPNRPAVQAPARSITPLTPRGIPTTLTQRELEVAALVARGLTNRQIANELVITEGTAANHVKHILARLVLDSRVQVAAWVIERGLHGATSALPAY